ncbi:MAG: FG-GAP repeat domain-containing protein [Verrucomicrobiota bacterium]
MFRLYTIMLISFVISTFGAASHAAEILGIGAAEVCGSFNGVRPSIDVDSKGQPHIIIDSGHVALGSTMWMFNKINGTWSGRLFADRSTTPYAPSAISQPWIEIDAMDRAWVFAQFFQAGVMRNSGQGVWLFENMTSNPAQKWFNKKQYGRGWGPGNLQIDPHYPNECVVMTMDGYWGIVNDAGVTTSTGQMGPRASGEKFRFRISPQQGQRGIWHGVMNGSRAGGSSAYRNSVMGSDQIWATYNPYSSQGDDHNHPGVCNDLENPKMAYIASVYEQTAKFVTDPPGLSMQIYDGNGNMIFGTDNLLMIDPHAKFVHRCPPAMAPAHGGGVWIAWPDEHGQIKMTYVSPEGEMNTPAVITSGAFCGINTDSEGNVHMAYVESGQTKYRKISVSGGVSTKAITLAADFDGDGLDDIAVYDKGTWHIRGTDDGGLLGAKGNYIGYSLGEAGDIPVPADYDGDGKADPAVYQPDNENGPWLILRSLDGQVERLTGIGGNPGDTPVPADYDGDGKADICVWDTNGTWHIHHSTEGYAGYSLGDPLSGDTPVPGDYDGDGAMDIGVYQENAVWHISRSTEGYLGVAYGDTGDIPIPQDYDGDGAWDIAVYRPSTHNWHIKDQDGFGYGGDGDLPVPGRFFRTNQAHAAVYRPGESMWILWMNVPPRFGGGPNDFPIPYKWDADDRADIAIYRNSNAGWYAMLSSQGYGQTNYGLPSDWAVPADYDGDGLTDMAVWRNGKWYIASSSNEVTMEYNLGAYGDIPVPADYDGDGLTDPAVYEPTTGIWHIYGTTTGYVGRVFGGDPGDLPLPMDVDADGKTDLVIYDRNSTWHATSLEAGNYRGVKWGNRDMHPCYISTPDGDTPALYDDASRTFHVYPGDEEKVYTLPIGPSDMVPVCADYDGDGEEDYAAFSPGTGEWIIRRSSDDTFVLEGDSVGIEWGVPGGIPIGVRQK